MPEPTRTNQSGSFPLCVVTVLEMVPGLYVLGCSQAELGSQRVDTRIKLSAFETLRVYHGLRSAGQMLSAVGPPDADGLFCMTPREWASGPWKPQAPQEKLLSPCRFPAAVKSPPVQGAPLLLTLRPLSILNINLSMPHLFQISQPWTFLCAM